MDSNQYIFTFKNINYSHKLGRASEPQEDYQKHMHCFVEVLYFIRGDVTYTVEAATRELQSGDLIFIAPNKYHFATVNDSVPYERYVLQFPESLLPEYLVKKADSAYPFFSNCKKFTDIFKEFDSYRNMFDNDELYTLYISATLKLLVSLFHDYTPVYNQKTGLVTDLINYIDENLYNRITLDTLNEHFNFSKSYISNEFRTQMKIPIMQYIRTKKILAAHKMLLNGVKKNKVAEMFGFEDYSTFYRSYVKVMGFSPMDGHGKSHSGI